jgi:hypothetical protein
MYFLHVSGQPRGFITRGHLFSIYNLPRCHQDTCPICRVATVTATVDTSVTVATWRIEAFFVVNDAISWKMWT